MAEGDNITARDLLQSWTINDEIIAVFEGIVGCMKIINYYLTIMFAGMSICMNGMFVDRFLRWDIQTGKLSQTLIFLNY